MACPRSPAPAEPSRAVAMVNDRAIYALDLRRELWRVHGKPAAGETGRLELADAILEQLIDRELLLRVARNAGVSVPERDVETAWEASRAGYNSKDFNATLYGQMMTPELMRQQLEERLVIERFLKERFRDLPRPTDEEVHKFYGANPDKFRAPARVRARQIVVMTAEEAELLRAKLLKGEDFDRTARQHSVAPERDKGGDLGFFSKGVMPEVFDEVCFNLKVGEISNVVPSEYGHHIFQVTERRPELQQPLETVVPEIRQTLVAAQREAAEAKLLAELRAAAKITKDGVALAWAADMRAVTGGDGGPE